MRALRLIGRVLLYGLATVGALALAGIAALALLASSLTTGVPSLPERIVLRLDLGQGLAEKAPDGPFELLGPSALTLRDAVDALAAGAGDARVRGVVVELGGARLGIAGAQELREALAAFRSRGKFALAFTESFGMAGGGTPEYYLASAAEQIWVQPSGEIGLTGLALETPFLRGALDKLDIEPRFERRQEYKSAVETFTRTGFTGPARDSLQRLVDSWLDQVVAGIAADRGLEPARVRALIDDGPYLAAEAREQGLVDRLGYADELWAAARALAGPGAGRVELADYLAAAGRPHRAGPRVALIYGLGAIDLARDDRTRLFDSNLFAARSVAETIAAAAEDSSIAAILFRIDSPGGSYLGSDLVRRAVLRARAAGKPVVASLGAVAASGGYFVAMAADRIVAQPGTVTGSIGVFAGKFVTEGFWRKLGITWDEVHAGARATMWSQVRDYPPGAAARLGRMIDAIYGDFTAKAAADRGLTAADMDAAARGRVWAGRDALDRGLIDGLGGYGAAVAATKELLGLSPTDDIELVPRPPPRSPFERLAEMVTGARPPEAGLAGPAAALARELAPILGDLTALRPPRGMLQLPPLRLVR